MERSSHRPPPRSRRRGKVPPPLASQSDEAPVELDVRVRPGTETPAERELLDLGASRVEHRGHGELRVTPGGPLRPLLGAERPLAIYLVRPLPGASLDLFGTPDGQAAALEVASAAMNLAGKVRVETLRVTGGPDLIGNRRPIGLMAGYLARRLGLRPVATEPDLVVIVRRREDGLEVAARLPRSTGGTPLGRVRLGESRPASGDDRPVARRPREMHRDVRGTT